MRLLLFTGKGGVGKTTAAAGTAALGAQRGLRTLVVSTDAAHSLGDAYGVPAAAAPTQVADRLFVQQVDAQRRLEESWGEIQGYLRSVLGAADVDPIAAEELTVLPGAEEVLALLEVRDQACSRRWDLLVVDCAPTAETLRLLALPDALGWYLDRVLPAERRIMTALRPVLARASGVPMPRAHVVDAVERLHADLASVRTLLTGAGASVRLVLTPEAVVVAEARRSLTTLALYGYRVDGVVANRVFPACAADAWRQRWVEAQAVVLDDVAASFAPLPIWRSAYLGAEPVGVDALAALAADLHGDDDPFAEADAAPLMRICRGAGGEVQLVLRLPLATRADVDLARRGDEVVVTVGSYRRVIALPAALRRCEVRAAHLDSGMLVVRFTEPAREGAL